MLIQTSILASCQGAIDKKDIRQHLRAICFDFDEKTNKLSIVGTNAQIMIVNTIEVENENDIAFCKKHFTDNTAYFWDRELNKKNPYSDFTEIDGKLVCNGTILTKLDTQYPNWKCVIPQHDLVYATKYCGFNADFIKQIDKALGWKHQTIITRIPRVNADNDQEWLAPHRWDLNIYDNNCETIVLCMPMRLD